MVRGRWAVGLVSVGLVACSVEVDVSELSFKEPDASAEADVYSFGPIGCPDYLHCLLGLGDFPADVEACLGAVAVASSELADQLEVCRAEKCGVLPAAGDQAASSAMLKCLLEDCTEVLVSCAGGRGDSTCLSYAVKWQRQEAGTTQCQESPPEICLVDYLTSIHSSEFDSVVKLIHCLAELPEGAVEDLPICLALCDS